MRKVLLVVGIDIAKDNFHVCVKVKTQDGSISIKGSRSFANNHQGFGELVAWVAKREDGDSPALYVMEATGSYYEDLAYYLYGAGLTACVVLPNKVKHFAKSLNIKSKTDKIDATVIAGMGMERELVAWKPMSKDFKQLRDLSRELLSIKKEKTRAKCQLHAMHHSHEKYQEIIELKDSQITFYEETISDIESEIRNLVKSDNDLERRIDNIMKVKGLGLTTIVTVLCETNGFMMFSNMRQVASYAGLDVELKESGTYKGKTRISKKGNARIRQCLFMPALSATTCNDNIKDLYDRIVERNPEVKRKGVVAAMRKLLILTFVLWKKDEEYDPNHQWGRK